MNGSGYPVALLPLAPVLFAIDEFGRPPTAQIASLAIGVVGAISILTAHRPAVARQSPKSHP
jgi:hypothetical protein